MPQKLRIASKGVQKQVGKLFDNTGDYLPGLTDQGVQMRFVIQCVPEELRRSLLRGVRPAWPRARPALTTLPHHRAATRAYKVENPNHWISIERTSGRTDPPLRSTFARFSSPKPLNLRNWPKCLKPLPIGLETLGGRKSKIQIMRSLEDIRRDKSAHLLFRAFVMSHVVA